MKTLKNIFVGFLVSFIGSIPLGYLNVVGFEIYRKDNLKALILYLLGVIIVEGIIIYGTLIFAKKLSENKKLLRFIDIFSIVFMFVLAAIFFLNRSEPDSEYKKYLLEYLPFVLGLFFSILNFIQIPFWLGWNLYLINNKYIIIDSALKYIYVFGAIVGTFFGMLCFVLLLDKFSGHDGFLSSNIISLFIPILFFAMGCFQVFKFFQKKNSKQK